MLLYRLATTISWPFVWVVFRPRVSGKQNLPHGGYVLSPNHLSGWDVVAISYATAPRVLRNMGKNQLFRRRLVGPLVRSLGAFPARDEDDLAGGVAAGAAMATAGAVVVIFPEGARRRGRERRPRSGAARTALTAGVPLVPAAIRGTDGWRERVRWSIAFGPPVAIEDLRAEDPTAAAREATRRLWSSVTALEATLAPASGGVE
jgi:1-acyl-sn-glycerol-3-phosphate acyltransferase